MNEPRGKFTIRLNSTLTPAAKRAAMAAVDREHPGVLLARDKANFSLPFLQIESAAIDPAANVRWDDRKGSYVKAA